MEVRRILAPGCFEMDGPTSGTLTVTDSRHVPGGTPAWIDVTETYAVEDPDLVSWFSDIRHREVTSFTVTDDASPPKVVGILQDFELVISSSPSPDTASGVLHGDHEALESWCCEMRSIMERGVWPTFRERLTMNRIPPGVTPAGGMCRLTSICLLRAIEEAFPDGGWTIRGGHPRIAYEQMRKKDFAAAGKGLDGGMWDAVRQTWDGHYWIEGEHDGERVVVDLTADQYGWDPVIVTSPDDGRYRGNYKGSTVAKDCAPSKLSSEMADLACAILEARGLATPSTAFGR